MIDSPPFPRKILTSDRNAVTGQGWLARRSGAFRTALLKLATLRHFLENEALYHIGDPADGLYAVISGSVKVTVPADDGQEFVAHREGVGFWIGDLALLSDARRLVTVAATSPVRAMFFPSSRIEEMVAVEPGFYRDFYALTYDNVETSLRIMANQAVQRSDKRLVLRLLHLHESLGHSEGWISLSQEDLAAMVAVSLPTLQRTLQGLSDKGFLELGYGRIRIRDRLALIGYCQD